MELYWEMYTDIQSWSTAAVYQAQPSFDPMKNVKNSYHCILGQILSSSRQYTQMYVHLFLHISNHRFVFTLNSLVLADST